VFRQFVPERNLSHNGGTKFMKYEQNERVTNSLTVFQSMKKTVATSIALPMLVLLFIQVASNAQVFPDGTKINLIADNGGRMTRCNYCQTPVNDSLNDTIVLTNKDSAFSSFEVLNDKATGKIMLKADSGRMLTFCNRCIVGGTVPDFIGVQSGEDNNVPFNKIELAKLPNGKYTLKAGNGKYITRCSGCSPSFKGGADVVTAHVADPNSPFAQWVIEPSSSSQYVIAHRCNTSDWVKNALKNDKINAIEADFRFGKPVVGATADWYLSHDVVDVASHSLNLWLKGVTEVAPQLSLLHVDIKSPEADLVDLYTRLRNKLPGVGLIFDFGVVASGKLYLKESIKQKIMADPLAVFAMGFDDSNTDVNQFFKDQGIPLNKYWYEIGANAAATWSAAEQQWAKDAVKARDEGTGPKVVLWSFESESGVNYWFKEGVDAILVNSSSCYGRTTAFATNADVHVKNAQERGRFGVRGTNPFSLKVKP
jgi:hypothetical protein